MLGIQRPAGSLLQTRQHPLCMCGQVLGAGKRGAAFQPCSEWGWQPPLAVALPVLGWELDPAVAGGSLCGALRIMVLLPGQYWGLGLCVLSPAPIHSVGFHLRCMVKSSLL